MWYLMRINDPGSREKLVLKIEPFEETGMMGSIVCVKVTSQTIIRH